MKKLLVFGLGLFAIAFTACKQNKAQSDIAGMTQNDSLQNIISQKDSEINDMMGIMNEIQEGFQKINEAENRVSIVKDGEGANKAQQIREKLTAADIPFDPKPFVPHITLGRKPVVPEAVDLSGIMIPPADMTVEDVFLYRSERGENGMVYSVIGSSTEKGEAAR